jgi:phytoene synthase
MKWFPMQMNLSHAKPADLEACRALLRQGSRSFHAASKLLPAGVFEPAGSLYAFCRLADDQIDDAVDGRSLEKLTPDAALARLYERLDDAYAGRPRNHPVDRALADMLASSRMPRALPEALLEGFSWDAEARIYETLSDVLAYAARVAGAVGAMMTVLMGRTETHTVARACDLGCAMQLSNIARDVGEDARAGRIYLPRTWLREEGIDPAAFLASPVYSPGIGRCVQRLLAVADTLYRRADSGIKNLPLSCRPGIGAARLMYAEIGHEVGRRGCNSIDRRAVVSGRRKLALLAESTMRALIPGRVQTMAPLAETSFLVDAVAHAFPSLGTARPGEVAWAIELFARLDARDARLSGAVARM